MSSAAPSSHHAALEGLDPAAVRSQQWVVVGLCLFFNMLDGFDITALAVVANPAAQALQLTPEQLGWVFSTALLGMVCGAMFLAPVSDLVGRRRLIVAAVALVGASMILTGSASSLAELIALRFASGLGAGAMLASQAALTAEYSAERYRVCSVAAVTSGYPLGAMLTATVAGLIVPELGWRGMFWCGGLLTLSMVAVAWLWMPESFSYLSARRPERARGRIRAVLHAVDGEELAELPELGAAAIPRRSALRNVAELLSRSHGRTTLTLWLAFFLCFCTLYFLMSWIPKLMEDAGFGAEAGREAFFMFNLGGVIGIYLMGWASTRFPVTQLVCWMSLAGAGGMLAFAFAPAQRGLLLALTLGIGILQQGGFTGLYGAAAKAYPTAIRSTGIGWAIGLGRWGAVAGPAAAGYLIAAGFGMSTNYVVFAIPLALGGLIALRLKIA